MKAFHFSPPLRRRHYFRYVTADSFLQPRAAGLQYCIIDFDFRRTCYIRFITCPRRPRDETIIAAMLDGLRARSACNATKPAAPERAFLVRKLSARLSTRAKLARPMPASRRTVIVASAHTALSAYYA